MTEQVKLTMYDWWLTVGIQETWAYTHNIFTDDEIDFINTKSSKTDTYMGKIGSIGNENEKLDYRNSTISNLESSDDKNDWIFERITRAVLEINKQFWNFDMNRIETLQHSVYDKGQFYKRHTDSMYNSPNNSIRKLSFSVMLSDSSEYEGGDLLIYTGEEPTKTFRTKGTIIFFPSYTLHEVTKVTKGTRRALVGWVTGPSFK
jgi:PKHD-type hydroxylase